MTWFSHPLRLSLASTLLLTSGLTAQTVWTGAASNAWSDSANWTAGVPTSISDAIIPVTSTVPSTAGSPFPAVRNLTVAAGAAFDIAATAPLDVFGSVSADGVVSGEMRLRGGGTIATSGTGMLETVRVVTGNYSVTDAVVDQLLHDPAAGPIVIDNAKVLSLAMFTGAGLVGSPGSSFECEGPVMINTTVPTTTPPETMLLRADWTSSASWQPTSGKVSFASPAALTANVAPNTHWYDLDVRALLNVSGSLYVDGDLRMSRNITVNGSVIDLVERAGISGGSTLGGAAVSSLRIRDGITSGGSIIAPNAVLDADGDMTFIGGGQLQVGAGTHTISNSLDMNGLFTVPAGSIVEFDGTGVVALSGASLMPQVRVSGSDVTILEMLVLGDFDQTASAGNVGITSMSVGGTCTFAGNSVTNIGIGFLNSLGALSFQTTGLVDTPPTQIQCSGSFSANGNFQPQSGQVLLNGAGAQTVTRTAFQWHDLHIEAGTQIVSSSPATILGDLIIRGELGTAGGAIECFGVMDVPGTLASTTAPAVRARSGLTVSGTMFTPAASLEVDGDMTVSGFVDIGSGGHSITGSMLVSGSFSMPANAQMVFDGTGSVNVIQTSSLGAVRFNGGDYSVVSMRAASNLEHAAGTLTIGSCTVGGNATFTGTTFTGGAGSLLEVDGSINIQTGSLIATPPATMRCGGDWTSNATFAPTSGLVEFDGAGDQVVLRPSFQWIDLRIQPGAVVYTTIAVDVRGDLDVFGQLNAFGNALQVDGDLTLRPGGLLQATSALNVAMNGNLQVDGTMAASNGALNCAGDVFVGSGGALALGVGPHALGGDLAVLGGLTVPANSETRLQGSGQVNVTSGNPLGNVSFQGGDFTVAQIVANGNVNHVSGELRIATLTCGGNANFQGAAVVDFAGGFVDVAGDLLFATSQVVTNPPSQLRVGGDWVSDASFAPALGVVEMFGTGPQSMSVSRLASLSVGIDSDLQFSANDLTVQNNLNVDGNMTAPVGSLQIDGNLAVAASGTMTLQPTSVANLAGSISNLGVIAGNSIRLSGTGAISGAGSYPDLTIAATGDYLVSGFVAIAGDVTMEAGVLALDAAASLQVAADFAGTAGALRGAAGSVLDIEGNAVLDGIVADAAGSPDLFVAGDYSASSAYAPQNGTVMLDGAGQLVALDGSMSFQNLVIAAGTRQLAADIDLSAADIDVLTGATLDVGVRRFDLSVPTMTVEGQLSIGTNGLLFLAPLSAVEITLTGALQMLGTWDEPAMVDGPVGGDYSFQIGGAFDAMNYSFAHMGPAGVQVAASAVLGAAPNDMRAGRFLDGSATPGACLLQIDRNAPAELRYITLDGITTFGVRTQGLAQVSFVNESGDRSGPTFEDDGSNRIDWLPGQRTDIQGFVATPSLHMVALDWTTNSEVDVDSFRIMRGESATGPFVEIGSIPATGSEPQGDSYNRLDNLLLTTTKYFYRLEEVLAHGEPRLLADDFARAWPDQVGNMTFVGPNGAYPDLATALAVTPAGGSIAVQSGTYAAFTINKAVRIFPAGDGPVMIDTTFGKMVIRDIPAGSSDLALYDLIVGSPSSPFGMEVVNCSNIIVLDRLDVSTSGSAPGLLIDDCTHIALQNCVLTGGPGLRFDNGSTAYLSRGSIDSLEVLRSSQVTYCDVTPGAMAVGIGSNADLLPGAMPDIDSPINWVADKPVTFDVSYEPNSFYIMLFSFRRGFTDLTPIFPIDMVLLVGQTGATTLSAGVTGPDGTAQFVINSPGNPTTFGTHVPLQLVGLDIAGGRFGSSRDAVFVP